MKCRLCKIRLKKPVLSLGKTALANEFLKEPLVQDEFPLDICQCDGCGHYQLSESVDAERLFRHYLYVAGTSPVNVKHFADYALDCVERFRLKPGDLVVDIASNDGTLLKEFAKLGMRVLGVDPAVNLAEQATADGIETIPEFFDYKLALKIVRKHGKAALVTANNVLAHTDTLQEIGKGVKFLLDYEAAFVFEVSYFKDVVEKNLFDTIYHEHTSYHLVAPLVCFFENLGMCFFDVAHIPNHGGSIRGFVRNGPEYCKASIMAAVISEVPLLTKNAMGKFQAEIERVKTDLLAQLQAHKEQGKTIAVYGMPAKATTLSYVFSLDAELISFAVDDAPLKQGTFSPGKHIPILPSSAIYERKPDVLLVLAWNFAESIMKTHAAFPGEWIVPLGGI